MSANFGDPEGTRAMTAARPAPGYPAPDAVEFAPRRGRRAAGYTPSDDYAREVFDMPATIPSPGSTVDFDRLTSDEDAPDFEMLAALEASQSRRQESVSAATPHAPPGAPIPGAFGEDFAIYGDPEPDSDPIGNAVTAPAVDPDRDLGITEKPDFYLDPSSQQVTHKVRFNPGKTLSMGRRVLFRADSRGVPIFSPGCTAAMAAAHYLRAGLMCLVAAVIAAAVSGTLGFLAIGADSSYLAVAEHGAPVTATVVNVTANVTEDAVETGPAKADLGAATVQTAAVRFKVDGKQYQRNVSTTSTSGGAMVGADAAWKAGEKVQIYADMSHTGQVVIQDPGQPGRWNFLSLSPLLLAACFVAGMFSAWKNGLKMRKITRSEKQ